MLFDSVILNALIIVIFISVYATVVVKSRNESSEFTMQGAVNRFRRQR